MRRGQTDGEVAPKIVELAKVVKGLKARVKVFGTARDTPSFRETVESDIEGGRALYTSAAESLLRGGRRDRDRSVNSERLQHNLNEVHRQFEDAVSKLELARRTKKMPAAAGAGAGGESSSDEEGDRRGGSRRRQQRQMEEPVFTEIEGLGAVEMTILQERNAEAHAIARDAVELNSMFRDVNVMITEQSEQLEQVEEHVTVARDKVHQGNSELEQAIKYQAAYRKKLCILFIIIIVVLGCVMVPVGLHVLK